MVRFPIWLCLDWRFVFNWPIIWWRPLESRILLVLFLSSSGHRSIILNRILCPASLHAHGLPRVALVLRAWSCQRRRRKTWGSIPGWARFPWILGNASKCYSCLEDPMEPGSWQATVHRVTLSRHSWSDLARMHASTTLGLLWNLVPFLIEWKILNIL